VCNKLAGAVQAKAGFPIHYLKKVYLSLSNIALRLKNLSFVYYSVTESIDLG
jgi:hypothetical protein